MKYPRVALTSAAQTENGYEGYFVSQDTATLHTVSERQAWGFFNMITAFSAASGGPHVVNNTSTDRYNASGDYTGSGSLAGVSGDWIYIRLPNKIQLQSVDLWARYTSQRNPVDATVLGSLNGTNWSVIGSWTGASFTAGKSSSFIINSIQYYDYIGFVFEKIEADSSGRYVNFTELELYGIPEYDPEAHGTDVIARSVPNVPNTDFLEVYYDGQDYTSMPSTVTDKSGNGVTGTPTNGVTFDSTWKAFNFDAATNQYITATTTNQAGAFVHTVSMWVKFSELTSSQHFLFRFGSTAGAAFTAIGMYYSANQGIRVSTGVDYRTRFHPTPGEWVHIMYSYSGGTLDEAASDTRVKFYVNGVRWQFQDYWQGGSVTPAALNLPGTNTLQVNGKDGTSNIIVDMSVANFRLFNRALTADEAWQLYAYQKDYFQVSPDVVTFKGGRLGIGTLEPRAVLDVRGSVQMSGFSQASGGGGNAMYTNSKYTVHKFTSSGTFTVIEPGLIEYIIVGGGGGGGSRHHGAGGGGGVLVGTMYASKGDYTVTVGAGGSGNVGGNSNGQGGHGNDSTFAGLIGMRGGGAARGEYAGYIGCSGGTHATNAATNIEIAPQGYGIQGWYGGRGNPSAGNAASYAGGGGGGAGGAGGHALPQGNANTNGGAGGPGRCIYGLGADDSDVYLGGGGGGDCSASSSGSAGSGGIGGGGNGSKGNAQAGHGEANTGGGGGGGGFGSTSPPNGPGGNGGSGVVYVRYLK